MIYLVTAEFKIEAESPAEALAIAAACVEHWDETTGVELLRGIGGAQGSVSVREKP